MRWNLEEWEVFDYIIRIIIFTDVIAKNFDRNRLQKTENILRMYGLVKEYYMLQVILRWENSEGNSLEEIIYSTKDTESIYSVGIMDQTNKEEKWL